MASEQRIEELVRAVCESSRYRNVAPQLVRRVAASELAKGRNSKETLKAVKNKLHQVGGAYLDTIPNYPHLLAELEQLPTDLSAPEVQAFCRQTMRLHASTRERLPILDQFYSRTLASLGSLQSVLDLACGMNPLTLPWMPHSADVQYFACDIYSDLTDFLQAFLEYFHIQGEAGLCDLTQEAPQQRVQLALILKTLPCLEQVEKTVSLRLLDEVSADYLLVSFPAQSLGGRSKGMPENYAVSFRQLLGQRAWQYEQFEFETEIAFLVQKS